MNIRNREIIGVTLIFKKRGVKDMSLKSEYYERKRINQGRYIYEKNLANSEIETLTPEQHEKIQELCEMRHKLYSGDMFGAESSCLGECSRYFLERIEIEGVGVLDIGSEIDNLVTAIDLDLEYYEIDEDERPEYQDAYNEFKRFNYDQIEGMNEKIEEFLADIDERFKTHYCPTGKSRGRIL